jgi:hypothetical protein
LRAVQRQEELKPGTDFVKATLGEPRPIPEDDAARRTLASLAGRTRVVDLGGSGPTSTIGKDFGPMFLGRLKSAERARATMADRSFPEAMAKARAEAARSGHAVTAEGLNRALAQVKTEKGPQPPRPPQPVTPLLVATAAKAESASWSPVADRFGGGR